MKKKRIKIAIIISIVLVMLNFKIKSVFADINKYTFFEDKKIILVDPGHGGIDGGASAADGTLEKDINLSIGVKLKGVLEKNGFKVIMTREEDKGLYTESGTIRKKKIEDLDNRCKLKEGSHCDMFISIHLNIYPEGKYYGAQVWHSKNEASTRLSHIIQEEFKANMKDNNKRIEKPALDKYKVLRCCDDVPSVIVECGFLSNNEEAQKLKSDSYQQKIAEVLEKSIIKYYSQ